MNRKGTLEARVSGALRSLEAVKQEVLRLRFGLGGGGEMSRAEVAEILTVRLDPAVKLEIVTAPRRDGDELVLRECDVEALERAALRELTKQR